MIVGERVAQHGKVGLTLGFQTPGEEVFAQQVFGRLGLDNGSDNQ